MIKELREYADGVYNANGSICGAEAVLCMKIKMGRRRRRPRAENSFYTQTKGCETLFPASAISKFDNQ
jgi:hypothetical protein